MSAATAMSAQRRSSRLVCRRLVVSDPKPLSLPFDGAPQIPQLGFYRIVDRLSRVTDVVRDLLAQVLATIPQVFAAVGCPSSAGRRCAPRAASGPAGSHRNAAQNGRHRASAGRSAAHDEREARADGKPDQRCCE
jgi:hypothetical protein